MRHHTGDRVVLRILALVFAAPLFAVAPANAQDARAESAAMAAKIERMQKAGEHPRPPSAPPVSTAFTDREVNSYLQVEGPMFLPAGIAKPRLSIDAGGKITGRAVVDLDKLSLSQPRGLLDPLAFVRGSVEVVATGSVAAGNGRGVAHFESATIAGIPVPKAVAQEVLRFTTRTEQRPEGFAFDTPFDLPANIRGVAVDAGRVTVTQ